MTHVPEKGAIVRKWTSERLSGEVETALRRLARSEDVRRIAVMPDVHLARDVCIGTVVATERLLYPSAVGGDIGCGMAAIAFDAECGVIDCEATALNLLRHLADAVPIMRHSRSAKPDRLPGDLAPAALSDPKLQALAGRDGLTQLGTLGRGNHFMEFQADEDDRLWLMVHSGSRAMGQAINRHHLESAGQSRTGLRFIDSDDNRGKAYLNDVEWGREYARVNRRAMVIAACESAMKIVGADSLEDSYFDCDHNHLGREEHFGREVWVHRKGAMHADDGWPGIVPGSMATESYHVRGRGVADALCSSAHGAGRAISRTAARRRFTARDVARQVGAVWFDTRRAHQFREEAPEAYKDVTAVMRAQRKLVKIVRKLRPMVSFKGT